MDRLTKRGHKKLALLIGTSCSYGHMSYDCQLEEGNELLKSALDKLAMYEDLEEQDRLLKLPCRLGDTVYILNQKRIIPLEICEIYFDSHRIEMTAKNREELGYRTINLTEDGIGVEWYKTEEEAKAAKKISASMKKDELIAFAKENNIEVDEKATKAVIIETIEAALK